VRAGTSAKFGKVIGDDPYRMTRIHGLASVVKFKPSTVACTSSKEVAKPADAMDWAGRFAPGWGPQSQ